MKPLKIFFLFIIGIFLNIQTALCEISPQVYKEIKKDFSHLSALIIGIEDGKITIDKGEVQGVKPKDIFVVYKKIKKIIQSDKKETSVLLEKVIGKIEVVNVEENFAIARVISQTESFSVPAPIERFAHLKILVISEVKPPDKTLFLLLKNTLSKSVVVFDPKLKFKDLTPEYLLSHGYDLVFDVEENVIKVFDQNLDLIRYYGILSYKNVESVVKKVYKLSNPNIFSINPPTLLRKIKGEIFQAEFSDIDNNGVPEIAYFNSQGLFITNINGKILAHYKPKNGKIVNFSIGPSGWLVLNIFDGAVMRSEVLKYNNNKLHPIIRNINLILNFVDYKGCGIKDTLIGQTFDSENFFGDKVYILEVKNQELIYKSQIKVPQDYKNIGSSFVDLDGDGKVEIINYLSDGRLAVYKDSNIVWTSPYPVAKHFYEVKLTKGKNGQEVVKRIVFPYITPVSADINKDGKIELLFVSIDFPLENVESDLKYIPLNSATSQVFLLGFDGAYYFKNLWNSQAGFITGLGVFKNSIYYILVKGKYPGEAESELFLSLF